MSNYDQQYQNDEELFGLPYEEFESFVSDYGKSGGTALDIGCGQGRDALMLAKHGYTVVGVDGSQVGIDQMVGRAKNLGLDVRGVVANFFEYFPSDTFDAVVLDSILHFEKGDVEKELALLDRLSGIINPDGFFFIFIHRSRKKEKVLTDWYETVKGDFKIVKQDYIDYVYEEKASDFRSEFQYLMFVLERVEGIA